MKNYQRNIGLSLILILCSSSALWAREGRPHGKISDPTQQSKLVENMNRMELYYFQTEKLAQSYPFDDKKILEQLNNFSDVVDKLKGIVHNKDMIQRLSKLSQEVTQLKVNAPKQNPMVFQRKLKKLYNTCFACHTQSS